MHLRQGHHLDNVCNDGGRRPIEGLKHATKSTLDIAFVELAKICFLIRPDKFGKNSLAIYVLISERKRHTDQ